VPAALLVISDDPELRDLLLELAIEEGWGVRAVQTEAEAAVAVQTERPGLVVVDLDMTVTSPASRSRTRTTRCWRSRWTRRSSSSRRWTA
jgi:DNA-binding response OmpR family regulator